VTQNEVTQNEVTQNEVTQNEVTQNEVVSDAKPQKNEKGEKYYFFCNNHLNKP
jgi:hypothetical protein